MTPQLEGKCIALSLTTLPADQGPILLSQILAGVRFRDELGNVVTVPNIQTEISGPTSAGYPTWFDNAQTKSLKFWMPVDAESLKHLIAEELVRVQDARVVSHIRSLLIEPYAIMRDWDYGAPGQQYPCWMVLNDPVTDAELGYCEEGFGPERPWGLVGSGERRSMGMDSGWFTSFMDAYFESFACTTLRIWRAFKVDSDGTRTPISAEGDWDSTWREVMQLRENHPGVRYDCSHSISYG